MKRFTSRSEAHPANSAFPCRLKLANRLVCFAAAAAALTLGPSATAQYSPLPYSNYNWNDYTGMMNYNYDYSR
jgi:hypothetical protein